MGWRWSLGLQTRRCGWNVTTGAFLQTIGGHLATIRGVAFGADNETIVSASEDATVRMWRSAAVEPRRLSSTASTQRESWLDSHVIRRANAQGKHMLG